MAYETDDLPAYGELVRALRETESRRLTVGDTPMLTASIAPSRDPRAARRPAAARHPPSERCFGACRREPWTRRPCGSCARPGGRSPAYRKLRETYGSSSSPRPGTVRRGHADAGRGWASTPRCCSPTSCCRSSRWASALPIEPGVGPIIHDRSARTPTSTRCVRSSRRERSFTLDAIRLMQAASSTGGRRSSASPGRRSRSPATSSRAGRRATTPRQAFMYREPEAWHALMAA